MDDFKKKLLREEYISRINRVQDYIEENIGEELTLTKLSQVANFSPYHFHRIYSALTGESLFQYIQRVRLEKAAFSLLANPGKTIVEIALEYGFTNQASFARSFKRYFNTSAGQWRTNPSFVDSKNCKMDSKTGQVSHNHGKDSPNLFFYNDTARKKTDWGNQIMSKISMQVEVKDVPEKHVVYIRHTGPYKGDSELFGTLIGKLCKWAGARDLINFPDTQMITVYHDNPDVTQEDKLRISVCLTVPESTEVSGEIGKMTITGGKYAIGHFELCADQYQDAWNALYADWLPESGYQPEDQPSFELYLNNPDEHPEKKHIVDIYMAVKPL